MAIGLQTHIWNNNIKSLMLLGLYPFIILGLVWACAYVVAYMQGGYHIQTLQTPQGTLWLNTGNPEYVANGILYEYWPLIVTGITLWFAISYFFHTSMIRALCRSQPVTRTEAPMLYNTLENLCIAQGIPMPQLEIVETDALNAFASGINAKSYTITVTRGLLETLPPDELEGVLAHELTHIINRDVRLLMVTIIFTGMVGFAAQMVWSQVRYGFLFSSGRGRDRKNGVMVLLALAVVLWVGYIATLFMRFALSRRREFMADAGAVQMTKNPEAMIRALLRISGHEHIPAVPADIAMMCIENATPFMGLFATHPSIESRVAVLAELTHTPLPDLSVLPAPRKNPWRRS